MSEDKSEGYTGMEVAIIGMAGAFPGAKNVEQFWRNLRDGVEGISRFSDEELMLAGIHPDRFKHPRYVKAKGVIEDVDKFDAAFFGYSPREAEVMDPQHRLFLEHAWAALENAGYRPNTYPGAIGLFAGVLSSDYFLLNLLPDPRLLETVGWHQLAMSNEKDHLTTRVAYKLNLQGPAVTVQTTCSTSLVAVHMACQSLLNGDSDLALAGGVSIHVPEKTGYHYEEGGILSPDGHCRPFDASAKGTVGGNGIGLVALKRLSEAMEDGDTIYAVIKGSAINNDGSAKIGYTAPRVGGQARVIQAALDAAEVLPETVRYIEAHGTATSLGDPIEVAALREVFGKSAGRGHYCAIGSVKSNVGHLDAAAGVTGLIKAALALKHKEIPPSLHYEKPNPEIDFDNSPFYVAKALEEWKSGEGVPRRAGVSSFGIGGTNAHVVLEEAPAREEGDASRPWQLLTLSAKTDEALRQACANLRGYLIENEEVNLADVAYTLQVGREEFERRVSIVAESVEDAVEKLMPLSKQGERTADADRDFESVPTVAFMFSGQGAQYAGMGRGLYEAFPVFREEVDRCAELLRPHLGRDIREIMDGGAQETLRQTCFAQPALFVTEYALAKLLEAWGVEPDAMIGHSIGEYVAACLAGVFSLEDALRLVAVRGRLMQEMAPGAMLSVPLGEREVRGYLGERVSLAAVNAPGRCVLSGEISAIEAVEKSLSDKGVVSRRLHTSHAFHSAMMDPMLEAFRSHVAAVSMKNPKKRYLSNRTGTWVTSAQATDPEYWVRHLREAVRFSDGIQELLKDRNRVLLEVGPGTTLKSLVKLEVAAKDRAVVSSMRAAQEEIPDSCGLLLGLGRLWAEGVRMDWEAFWKEERRLRIPLPVYPFQRRRYWIEPGQARGAFPLPETKSVLEAREDLADWFYVPSWRETGKLSAANLPDAPGSVWLVFAERGGVGSEVVARLRERGQAVVVVWPGERFAEVGENELTMRPGAGCDEDYRELMGAIDAAGLHVERVLHCWLADDFEEELLWKDRYERVLDRGFRSLVSLAKASRENGQSWTVVTCGALQVSGNDVLNPLQATVTGPCRVIPLEYPHVNCRMVDLDAGGDREGVAEALLSESGLRSGERVMGYRGGKRFEQQFVQKRVEPGEGDKLGALLKDGGVYLITGGLGSMGLAFGCKMARRCRGAKLILLGRSGAAKGSSAADKVREMEALGAEVLFIATDVGDETQLSDAIREGKKRFGKIDGVVHTAGVLMPGLIELKTDEEVAGVFRPKVEGTLLLDGLLKDEGLDFMVLCSSISSISPLPGQVAYGAANAFLDAFAAWRSARGEGYTVSVDWGYWQELGIAAKGRMSEEEKRGLRRLGEKHPGAGVEMFERVLDNNLPAQVVICPVDLTAARVKVFEKAGAARVSPRREVREVEDARDEVEEKVAAVLRDLLGVERAGREDSFFELGGDSLMGLRLISRLEEACGYRLQLKDVFEAPTMEGLAAKLRSGMGEGGQEELRPMERESRRVKLSELRAFSGEDWAEAGEGYVFPVTAGQEQFCFLERLNPGTATYNVAQAFRLRGKVDVGALGRAGQALVDRHEILRTVFGERAGEIVQAVRPQLIFSFREAGEVGEEHLQNLMREEFERPFDLSQGPLLRGTLYRMGEEEVVVQWVMHHIVADAWSLSIFNREFMEFFRAFCEGGKAALPELRIQYGDFAVWRADQTAGDVEAKQMAYWKEKLRPELPILQLPSDRSRSSKPSYRGSRLGFRLDRETYDALKALAHREGTTVFMTLLACYKALLLRYTGQTDLIVAAPIAGRGSQDLDGLIGFFVNLLVLRTDLSGDLTFGEVLERVKGTVLDAFSNQDVPFERVVKEVDPDRDHRRNPLFQVVFVHQNIPAEGSGEDAGGPGLRIENVGMDSRSAKFDMTLTCVESPENVRGELEYMSDLFDRETAARFLTHFRMLLETAVRRPEEKISRIALLSGEERERVLEEWNATDAEYPAEATVHGLFERRAAEAPGRIAVAEEGRSVSYGELNRRANRLARYLLSKDLNAGDRVCLCLERSIDYVTGMLGVLKAGGAYVPVDPAYPQERKAFMLEDSGSRFLIGENGLSREGVEIVRLEDVPEDLEETNPREGSAGELAYVIYTSGSTGTPKGVMIPHRGVVNLSSWHQRRYGVRPEDRGTLVASVAFDASVWETWPYLTAGASVWIADQAARSAPGLLRDWLVEKKITVSFLPTALGEEVLREDWPEKVSLRSLLVGGDKMSRAPERRYPFEVVNHYGPTENSVVSTFGVVECGEKERKAPPIGKPIANTKAYVLDADMQPVPVGVAGELHVTGAGLAMGYWNRPELTAEKFVEGGFGGARLYKTGDLARWLPDGNLEFLGRLDDQVKIRGFRIELGEIESALGSHPKVRECVVVARRETEGARLVGYVTGEEGVSLSTRELREYLGERLPGYMVPAAMVVLEALPLSPNGKVDRAALSKPSSEDFESGREYIAPRTEVERKLASVWEELLDVRPIGVYDDYFDLGGNSILGMRLNTRMNEELGIEIPLAVLFENPRIASMAAYVEGAEAETKPAMIPRKRGDRFPLSFGQKRLWFLSRLKEGDSAYQIPMCLLLEGPLRVDGLEAALRGIMERHEILRTVFEASGDEPVQRVLPSGERSFEWTVADFEGVTGEERQRQIRALLSEAGTALLDVEKGPLWRARLIRLGPEEHLLSLTLHHLIFDGWSMDVFCRELGALYAAFVEGGETDLPELPVQYADYAVWQQEALQGAKLEEKLTFWKEQLREAPALLELPADCARPAEQSLRGETLSFEIEEETAWKLRQISQRRGATMFMTLLAAYQALLAKLSGQEDIVVGSPIAGRDRAETQGLIGFFVNTLALRARVEGEHSFEDLVDQARSVVTGALARQDLPFEKLVEEIRPERSLSYHPVFQAAFSLQNEEMGRMESRGLKMRTYGVPSGTAKFDLNLTLVEGKGGLKGSFEFACDLFEKETVVRWAEHFAALLRSLAGAPGQPLAEHSLLSGEEARGWAEQWASNRKPYPEGEMAHRLFEEQVDRAPEAVVVVYEEKGLTYGELEERSNRLAHYLRGAGVGPEVLVGICLERSIEAVVCALGILKAGGAYVPLDPSHPAERLHYMVEESGMKLLLTGEALMERLPEVKTPLVCVDADWKEIGKEPATRMECLNRVDHLAYVIYTSGSTGRPKGVMVEHRNLMNLVRWHREVYEVGPEDRATLVAGVGFDAAVWELWPYLTGGASLYIAPEEARLSGAGMKRWLLERKITLSFLPTALGEAVLQEDWAREKGVALRALLLGGDRLHPAAQEAYPFRVMNHYGPTENAVVSTWGEVDCREREMNPPIGRALPNVRAYVLDAELRPVAVGVAGELCVAGASLARGYLNQPELTAERFVKEPLGLDEERLYRTGDVVRYRSDGRIEFLGRMDDQVKVRGFRIELGEIEAVLNQHEEVKESVVTARERGGEAELTGYVKTEENVDGLETRLRRYLQGKLPDYMIPPVFVFLPEFPLTRNGKVDRRALPDPGSVYGVERGKEEKELPKSEMENLIAEVWRDVLGKNGFGVDDNFFEVGGHSLKIAQVHSRLSGKGFDSLKLVDLFRYPTIRALANFLVRGSKAEIPSSRFKVQGGDIAIVGMAGRFPGAEDLDAFWKNVSGGVESIRHFTDEELLAAGVPKEALDHAAYVKAAAVLSDVELFDAAFFEYSPREAEFMDPQQRLFLETAWTALESAGYDPSRYGKPVGVFGGSSDGTYSAIAQSHRDAKTPAGSLQLHLGNSKDFLTTRVSYKLNLEGPSVPVNTACSTSLVAVHMACRSLWDGECEMALAGGVSVRPPQIKGYFYQDQGIMSPDGHCRPFDAEAKGTCAGNGVGIVVLKRLEEAERDGDVIHAVVKGSAINNDGSFKVGFMAPRVDGQAKVIRAAQAMAGVDPRSLSYIEAHGTGTAMGDPIEVEALGAAFHAGANGAELPKGYCAIGSVKSNIGHLDAAAGVAGLIKTVLALKHRRIPPSLHFKKANPDLDLENSPFYVAKDLDEWKSPENGRRRAGVSSFGIGGTNAHVVLEEAAEQIQKFQDGRCQLLMVSAKTEKALEASVKRLREYLAEHSEVNLADVAYTLRVGRAHWKHRTVVVAKDAGDAVEQLRALSLAHENQSEEERIPGGLLEALVQGDGDRESMLREVGALWAGGAVFEKDDVRIEGPARRVQLPSYPFERKRYWIEPQRPATAVAAIQSVKQTGPAPKLPVEEWFYVPGWKRSPVQTGEGGRDGVWLVFEEEGALSEALAARLPVDKGVWVRPGSAFRKVDDRRFEVRPGEAEDYERLVQEMLDRGWVPRNILHLWTVTGRHEKISLETVLERGYRSLAALIRVVSERVSERVELGIVSNGLYEVTGDERVQPEKALVMSFSRVVPQEVPQIRCRNIDVVLNAEGSLGGETLDGIIQELNRGRADQVVAFRGRHRWVEDFEKVSLEKPSEAAEEAGGIRAGGVYLITGGLGGVGLEVAETLARWPGAEGVKLVLCGRSIFPEREQWDHWLKEKGEEEAVSQKIRRICELEATGCEVMVARADVSDAPALKELLEQVEGRFGSLNGVLHCAGVALARLIKDVDAEGTRSQFASKVTGLTVLEDVLGDRRLDFVWLCSSLSTVLGGLGRLDYTAANAYLDAYAQAWNGRSEKISRIVSVDWDGWEDVGMGADISEEQKELRRQSLGTAIFAREGREAIARVLIAPLPQVLVSTQDLDVRLGRVRRMAKAVEILEVNAEASSVELLDLDAALPEGSEIERKLASIWMRLLGVSTVEVTDNFFELGGDSLVGLQLIATVKTEFDVALPATSLYEAPTISAFAALLENKSVNEPQVERSVERARMRREKRTRRKRVSVNVN